MSESCPECARHYSLLDAIEQIGTERDMLRFHLADTELRLATVKVERDLYRDSLRRMTEKRDALFEEATAKGRELARLEGMRCETCQHVTQSSDEKSMLCRRWVSEFTGFWPTVQEMGGGCRAWEGR
jgi:hypothetical protein